MSELTKQALKVENNQSFPNNNAGLITPSALRTFNENMIDSLVDEIAYNADSASFNNKINALSGSVAVNTGSLLVTASFASQNLTFTKGDGSQFSLFIPDNSGSVLPSGVVSGSSQINYPQISNIPAGIVSGSSQITPLLPTGVVSGSSQVSYPGLSNIPAGIVSGSSQVSYTGLSNIPSGIVSGAAQITPLLPSGVVSGSSQVSYTGLSNIPAGIVSGSSQIILQQTTGLLSGSRIDGAVTSSLTSSLSNQTLDVVVNVKNSTGIQINKGTIVRIIGATGDNPLIQTASWDNDGSSANTLGWVQANIPNGEFGRVVTQGILTGVNTDPTNGFTPGQVLYLSSSGQYTNVIPPAPYHEVRLGQVLRAQQNQGSVFVQVQNGYELTELHDVNITTSSLANNNVLAYNSTSGQWVNQTPSGLGVAMTGSNNTFSGTQTFNNIVVNGTASIAYIQNVTGSAKIIGDAFIVLNNDTPAERYAGIIVVDSGSANTTASFQFDGQTNDWFYTYTDDGGVTTDLGVALFGPEYKTQGSPTYPTNNRIQKGTGTHHLTGSNISDDGSNVSINSNTQITGSLLINGDSPLFIGSLASLNNFTTSIQAEVDSIQAVTGSYATTGSNTFNGNQIITGSVSITGSLNITPLNAPNTFPAGGTAQFIIPFLSGSTNTFVRDIDNALFFSPAFNQLGVSSSAANTSITPGSISATNSSANNSTFNTTRVSNRPVAGKLIGISGDPSLTGLTGATTTNPAIILESGSATPEYYTPIQFQSSQSFSDGRVTITTPLIGLQGAEITGSVRISGNLTASIQEGFALVGGVGNISTLVPTSSFGGALPGGLVSGSSQIDYPFISNIPSGIVSSSSQVSYIGLSNIPADIVSGSSQLTASYDLRYALSGSGGGGSAFPFTGNAQISGSLGVTGSLNGFVNTLSVTSLTASVNFNDGNMFTITLPTGSVTHITPTNIRRGQTINIQVSQAAGASTGSVTFSPNVLFAGGADYQATATGSAIDLLTLVSLDGTNVLGVSIRNFQ